MRLMDYLPDVWDGSAEVLAIEDAIQPAVLAAWAAQGGLLEQLTVSTATWGLTAWERALALPLEAGKPVEFRRTRVMSKLRGQGTTTVAMIKNVAESFSNGAVDVVERVAEYMVDIKFVGTIGLPPNMEDLTAALSEIMPAHLGYDYIIIYRTWGQLAARTWGQLASHTWGEVLGGDIG